jgi:5'-nucleotidase
VTLRTLSFVVALSLASAVAGSAPRDPASLRSQRAAAPAPQAATVDVQLLAFNDFHGSLDPRSGTSGRIGTTDAGGIEYLASELARLKATNPNTAIVSAGDNIGATPLLSSMFHDEPTVEGLNAAGLLLSAVGNHELDEGWAELVRMQRGGCHPTDGCQDHTPYTGATFQYLAANIWIDPRFADADSLRRLRIPAGTRERRRLFPAFSIETFDGVRVGFIGLTLRTAPQLVSPAGVRGLTFQPEAQAANDAARTLRERGVHAVVVLIHEGGNPTGTDINGCQGFAGPIIDIVRGMSDDIDVVVSGHTHQAYNCTIGNKLVTSAASYGRLITDIDLQIDRKTDRIVSKRARNVIVSHDVAKAAAETSILAHYRPLAATLGDRVVTTIAAPLTREPTPAGECSIGDVIADGMLAGTSDAAHGRAVLALMNPGGIRADLLGKTAGSDGARAVSYEQVFDVMPFGNQVVVRTMTGEALLRLLDQQFDNRTSDCGRMLQVSHGFTYRYDPARPKGQRIDPASVQIAGRRLDPTARYRVASNDFVWAGGDNFTVATEGFDPQGAGVDLDLFVHYLGSQPRLAAPARDRIQQTR